MSTASEGHAYWEGRLGQRFSLDGVGHMGLGESFNGWMYHVRRQLFLRRVGPFVQRRPTLDVLDVGSGTGFYVDAWRELSPTSIEGMDITDTAVERLKERFPEHEFRRGDIGAEDLDLPTEAYDAVSAFDVLFHLVDDASYRHAFRNVAEALRPGGIFAFTDILVHGPALRAPQQVCRPLHEAEAAIRDAGLEPMLRRPVFVLMSTPVDSESRVHKRWWRSLERAVRLSDVVGQLAGASLSRLELALATRVVDGPSTEMMLCRKPD